MLMDPLYVWIAILIDALIVGGAIGWMEFKKFKRRRKEFATRKGVPDKPISISRNEYAEAISARRSRDDAYDLMHQLPTGFPAPPPPPVPREIVDKEVIEDFDPTKRIIR